MDHKEVLTQIFNAGINAVAPDKAIYNNLTLRGTLLQICNKNYDLAGKKTVILGAGKAAAPMAQAIENILGNYISTGLIIVKYEHGLPLKYIKEIQAGHPVPDMAGVKATRHMLEIAKATNENDLIIFLLSGGASALTPAPSTDLSLEDVQITTKLLLECGATIHEINAIRKHLSAFSGGQLVRISKAPILSLIVSDVIGDDTDVIGSGPTVPDSSYFYDCQSIIEKYNLQNRLPEAVRNHLQKGLNGEIPETPKADDKRFSKVNNILIATNSLALSAAAEEAQKLGYHPVIIEENMIGEARCMAETLINKAKSIASKTNDRICLLAGGETTVTIKGNGKGGRNQEMALSASLTTTPQIVALFAGTDGTDGPTDAAGGFAVFGSLEKLGGYAKAIEYIENNDSYNALSQSGNLFKTGPTRTNVMDMAIILIN